MDCGYISASLLSHLLGGGLSLHVSSHELAEAKREKSVNIIAKMDFKNSLS